MLVFGLMGFTYGPLGTALAGLFWAAVRYTGASLTFNFGGIVGASLANSVAPWLATHRGLGYVGLCLTIAGVLTALALPALGRDVVMPETGSGTAPR